MLSIDVLVPDTPLFNGQGPDVAQQELLAATEESLAILEGAIAPLAPINLGLLRGGVATQILGASEDGVLGRIYDPVLYANPVEHGTRPHFPPSIALAAWAQRKFGLDAKEARSVGFLIARAISRRGTKAVRFFARGKELALPRVNARFSLALTRVRDRLASGS